MRVPSIPLPDYPKVRVAAGFVMRIRHLLEQLQPDVVHVASPFVLGWRAIQAADALGLPTVSIYQTEVPTYAARYRVPWAKELMWQHVERMHNASTLTLVPSSFCKTQLRERGIHRLKTWRRGVDLELFSPKDDLHNCEHGSPPTGRSLSGLSEGSQQRSRSKTSRYWTPCVGLDWSSSAPVQSKNAAPEAAQCLLCGFPIWGWARVPCGEPGCVRPPG